MQLMALRKKAEGSAPPERKPGRRLTVRRGAALLLVLALAAGAALGGKALFFSGEEQTPLTEQTTYGSLSTTLSGTGTTMPADSVTYTTASEAEITGVYVSAGDTVEVGDLLYTQDDSELDDQIEEYQDQITEQENQLDDYQEQLAQLQEEIAALTVTAPFAGRITDVAVDVGDNVAAGTKLATLVDDSQMCLTQYFSYAYEDQVYVGMKAGVSVASLMLNQEGTVTDIQMVDRVTAEGTHCFAVTVTLDNPGAFTEGMTGAGYLVADSGEKLYPSVEGELEYRRSQDLTAEVGGEVTGIGAVDYEQVSAGAVLVQLDGADYQKQVESVNKQITQTQEKIVQLQEKIAEAEEKRSDYAVTAELAGKIIMVNVREGNRYEDNMEIWENDVQIVTSLVGDTMSQYIYYEIRGIQESRQQYQDFFVNMIRFSIIAFTLILVLFLFLSYYIPLSITSPIRRLTQVTDQVAKGDLTVRSDVTGGVEAQVLSDSLNTMIDKINELLEQVKTEQIRLRKAEFELLQSQINPHFLYNTLDAIVWLAEAGEQKKVVSMVGSLSDFFRISLNQGQDILDVKEELQHVRSYLEIQQMRYQDILQYEICVPEELNHCQIPKITLQPLVENALYHGIKNKRGKGMIRIEGELDGEDCILLITDNGKGMTPERLEQVRKGIRNRKVRETDIYGLYNVNERIRLNFGENYGITITSTYGEGTCVTVRLPQY